MKRVGIIGLGDMGIAMARNIIKSGFELTGFDQTWLLTWSRWPPTSRKTATTG